MRRTWKGPVVNLLRLPFGHFQLPGGGRIFSPVTDVTDIRYSRYAAPRGRADAFGQHTTPRLHARELYSSPLCRFPAALADAFGQHATPGHTDVGLRLLRSCIT
jgi:hypothetical protein